MADLKPVISMLHNPVETAEELDMLTKKAARYLYTVYTVQCTLYITQKYKSVELEEEPCSTLFVSVLLLLLELSSMVIIL